MSLLIVLRACLLKMLLLLCASDIYIFNRFFPIAILFIRFIFEGFSLQYVKEHGPRPPHRNPFIGIDNKYVLEIPLTKRMVLRNHFYNIGNPIYNLHARARLELASMVCHRCGHGVLDIDRRWRWVWNVHDSVWDSCEFHRECWTRWRRRAQELGGA